jgi:hypothetical protein
MVFTAPCNIPSFWYRQVILPEMSPLRASLCKQFATRLFNHGTPKQCFSNCGPRNTGGPKAVSEEKALQKLYQTLNELVTHGSDG